MPPATKRSSSTGKAIKRPVGRPRTTTKPATKVTRPSVRSAGALPGQSKDELRARAEKLERANTTLRIKNRTLQAALHDANDRVAELEEELASQQRRTVATGNSKPARASGNASASSDAPKPAARGRRKSQTAGSENHAPGQTGGVSDRDDHPGS